MTYYQNIPKYVRKQIRDIGNKIIYDMVHEYYHDIEKKWMFRFGKIHGYTISYDVLKRGYYLSLGNQRLSTNSGVWIPPRHPGLFDGDVINTVQIKSRDKSRGERREMG